MARLAQAIGESIKSRRLARGWSQEELGKKIGKSRQTVINYENGEDGIDVNTLADFARIFGCEETDLVSGGGHHVADCYRRIGQELGQLPHPESIFLDLGLHAASLSEDARKLFYAELRALVAPKTSKG